MNGGIQLILQTLTSMHVNDIIDIVIVTFIIYEGIRLFRETSTSQIARGVFILLIAMAASDVFDLMMLSTLFHAVFTWGIIVLAVVFQPELRRALRRVGKAGFMSLFLRQNENSMEENVVKEIVAACSNMSWSRTGALIIFERRETLDDIIRTGTKVDGIVVDELIRNIFYEGSPLHDGAMIIRSGRIHAAGCVLPLSDNRNLAKELGTRHRAAVGMSERADSISLIVSEETGAISVAIHGVLQRNLSPDELEDILRSKLVKSADNGKQGWLSTLANGILGIRGERS